MTIILDFNRTVYDPELDALAEGAKDALEALKAAGHALHLVSKLEPGRDDALDALGIRQYFESVAFVPEKEEAMHRIAESAAGTVFVVGDHLHNEIRIGNRLGARTVWVKQGKFASLQPEGEHDEPWRTASSMREVPALILG